MSAAPVISGPVLKSGKLLLSCVLADITHHPVRWTMTITLAARAQAGITLPG
jgi:hypothetical protein